MFCPYCRTKYREGFTECADCRVPLFHALPEADGPPSGDGMSRRLRAWLQLFLSAAGALRRAGIPFAGDEHYTGESRTGKREQAPYVLSLRIPRQRQEASFKALETLTRQM